MISHNSDKTIEIEYVKEIEDYRKIKISNEKR